MKGRHKIAIVAAIFLPILLFAAVWSYWARGTVVASSEFTHGTNTYRLTVRKIPASSFPLYMFIDDVADYRYHCQVTFRQIPVTSCTFFWDSFTPDAVEIDRQEPYYFRIRFAPVDTVECRYIYGDGANWQRIGFP